MAIKVLPAIWIASLMFGKMSKGYCIQINPLKLRPPAQ
jgi:hypothetical protein